MSEDLNTKSLGEKLFAATMDNTPLQDRCEWADLHEWHRTSFEATALAFAASLSHDETANAVITDLRQRLQAAEERAEKVEGALRQIAEGNLGSEPWQASYADIQHVARAALKTEGA